MCVKRTVVFVVLLFMVISTAVFSISSDQYEFAFKSGYDTGYTDFKTAVSTRTGIENKGKAAALKYFGRGQSDDDKQLRRAFLSGYMQGWDDKRDGKDNRYW